MPFAPTDITGCVLWLDASGLPAGALGSWADGSGAGNTVSAAGSARPAVVAGALNGLPVVRFDGVDDAMSAGAFAGLSSPAGGYSLFAVVIPRVTPDTYDGLVVSDSCWVMLRVGGTGGWGLYTGSGDQPASTALAADTPYLLEVVTPGSGADYYQQGTADGTAGGAIIGAGIGALYVGGQESIRLAQADVAEIVVYDSAISDPDRASVEAYLTAKWLPTSPPPPPPGVTDYAAGYMDDSAGLTDYVASF